MCCYNIYNATVVHFTGILLICCILEIESWKCLQADFSIFNNLLEKNGQAFSGQMLPGYTKAIITAHAWGHHMCVWAPGPTRSAPKQQKSGVHIKSSPNPVGTKLPLTKSKRNKYVSPLTGCAMKKCQGAAKSFSTLLDSNPCLLTHCNLP